MAYLLNKYLLHSCFDTLTIHEFFFIFSGSVDDHFAKSLGDKWSQIKAKNERDLFSGTVDDHFTKALGDTWLRLKAKQDSPPVSRDLAPAPSHITCGPHPLLHS